MNKDATVHVVPINMANLSDCRQAFSQNSFLCISTGETLFDNSQCAPSAGASRHSSDSHCRLYASSSTQMEQGYEAEFPSMGSKINLRWYANQGPIQDHIVAQLKANRRQVGFGAQRLRPE